LLGVGLALAIDAATFAVSAVMIWQMRSGGDMALSRSKSANDTIWLSVKIGLAYVWKDDTMRLTFLIIAAVNFLFVGPIMVGIPVLAVQKLPEGPVAFGLLMSGFAGGNLFGYVLAGTLPKAAGTVLRFVLIALLSGLR
jgi:hypothetical protein